MTDSSGCDSLKTLEICSALRIYPLKKLVSYELVPEVQMQACGNRLKIRSKNLTNERIVDLIICIYIRKQRFHRS